MTVVELMSRILPIEDEEVSAALRSALVKRGIKIVTGAIVSEVAPIEGGVRCSVRSAPAGSPGSGAAAGAGSASGDAIGPGAASAGRGATAQAQEIEVDRVLVAVGVTGAVIRVRMD